MVYKQTGRQTEMIFFKYLLKPLKSQVHLAQQLPGSERTSAHFLTEDGG